MSELVLNARVLNDTVSTAAFWHGRLREYCDTFGDGYGKLFKDSALEFLVAAEQVQKDLRAFWKSIKGTLEKIHLPKYVQKRIARRLRIEVLPGMWHRVPAPVPTLAAASSESADNDSTVPPARHSTRDHSPPYRRPRR